MKKNIYFLFYQKNLLYFCTFFVTIFPLSATAEFIGEANWTWILRFMMLTCIFTGIQNTIFLITWEVTKSWDDNESWLIVRIFSWRCSWKNYVENVINVLIFERKLSKILKKSNFIPEYYDNDQNQKMPGNSCQSYFELSDMFKSLIQWSITSIFLLLQFKNVFRFGYWLFMQVISWCHFQLLFRYWNVEQEGGKLRVTFIIFNFIFITLH